MSGRTEGADPNKYDTYRARQRDDRENYLTDNQPHTADPIDNHRRVLLPIGVSTFRLPRLSIGATCSGTSGQVAANSS